MAEVPPAELFAALRRMGLLKADATARGERLTGGVSSDIWRVDLPSGPVCVKRALAKLRVAADWQAPVERNRYEARWMRCAAAAVPGCGARAARSRTSRSGDARDAVICPRIATRCGRRSCAMAMPIRRSPRAVAQALVGIHAATAADPSVASAFPTDAIFYDIRLEPYLRRHRRAHPDLAQHCTRSSTTTQVNKHALVHGDVSPKNILRRPGRPGVPGRRVRLVGRSRPSTWPSASITCC